MKKWHVLMVWYTNDTSVAKFNTKKEAKQWIDKWRGHCKCKLYKLTEVKIG